MNRWSDDPDRSLAEAQRLADRCIELAPNEARAHDTAALAANFTGDIDRFRREVEIATALDPNYPGANLHRGLLCLLTDEPLDAVPHFERAMRRDPFLPSTTIFLQVLGMAYFFGGRYETAIALFRERIVLMPDTDWSRAYLASALGHIGQVEEARRVWDELMAINPKYSLVDRLRRGPTQGKGIERVVEGARKAALPV